MAIRKRFGRLGTALLAGLMISACTGRDQASASEQDAPPISGPPDSVVFAAWDQWYHGAPVCMDYITPTHLEIVGRTEQGNQAEVLVNVTADWRVHTRVGWVDPGFFDGPCSGFHAARGSPQTVTKHLMFTKYDTGYRFNHWSVIAFRQNQEKRTQAGTRVFA